MALRDQPYFPLYVQDFMTDEKLSECSPAATGVYIRLMCIMHKSDDYGKICYSKRDNKTDNKTLDFAQKLARLMPYSTEEIYDGLVELLDLKIVQISGEKLIQKRMVRDGELSDNRAKSGKKGMSKRWKSADKEKGVCYNKINNKVDNEKITNTEYENEYENDIKDKEKRGSGKKEKKPIFKKPTIEEIAAYCAERGNGVDPQRWHDFYTSNGWRVGKNSMKDWRAAVRTWEKNGIDKQSNEKQHNTDNGAALTANERKYGSMASTKAAILAEARELDRRRSTKPIQ